jgi:hypothetical protein
MVMIGGNSTFSMLATHQELLRINEKTLVIAASLFFSH